MVKFLSKWILKLLGWKTIGTFPDGKKYVVTAAPHTSTLDFIYGRLYYFSIGKKVKFMVKGAYFFFPLGLILKALGGIPVYPNKRVSLVDQMLAQFNQRDSFLLTIAPEGTRKKVKNWKKGFLYIAQKAKVPIVVGSLDFKNKTVGVEGVFYPSADMDADLVEIKRYYKNKTGRHPERFSCE